MNSKIAKPDVMKMEAALEAVSEELEASTDILNAGDGEAVSFLEPWQIEDIFSGLRSVMVQVEEALAHKREPQPAMQTPTNATQPSKPRKPGMGPSA